MGQPLDNAPPENSFVPALLEPWAQARFTGRASGKYEPAKQNEGFSGVCGSGWTICDNEEKHEVERHEVASREANRRTWAATIRAIRGILECSQVFDGATVEVLMRERTAADLFNTLLVQRTTGKPYADPELWAEVMELVRKKRLRTRARWCNRGEDSELDQIKDRVSLAIEQRVRELGPEKVMETAVAPKPNPKQFGPA